MRAIESLFTSLVRHEYARSMTFGPISESGGLPVPRPGAVYQLYVHIPFCPVLCPFCSFHRVQYQPQLAARYFKSLRSEIRRYHEQGFVFDDLYVGGGTPTVNEGELLHTLDLCNELFPLGSISVETNPSDLRPDLLQALRRRGVKRLSVGVQSFDDELLKSMDRYEKYGSAETLYRALEGARGVFPTLNVDMIFNLPGQTEESLAHDLRTLVALRPEQVSYYPLMVADSARRRVTGSMGPLRKSDSRRMFEQIVAVLSPDYKRSTAWCFCTRGGSIDEYIVGRDEYIGAGSGAFSYINGVIHATSFSINGYCRRIDSGINAITRSKHLSWREQMRYDFVMKLFGLSLDRSWLQNRYGKAFYLTMAFELLGMWMLGALKISRQSLLVTARGEYYWVILMREFFNNVNVFRDEMRRQIRSEYDDLAPQARGAAAVSPGPAGIEQAD
jgi:coproporphyrinogen III oxidase-like Fe-S oxidoreductase